MGAGYMPHPDAIAAGPATRVLLAVAGDRAVLGFCVFGYPARGGLREHLALPHSVALPAALVRGNVHGSVAVIEILAVDPAAQRRGIGRRLFRATEAAIVASQRQIVVVSAWMIGTTLPLARILAASGYATWATHHGHWRAACDGGAFACPHREERCRCSLALFGRCLPAR